MSKCPICGNPTNKYMGNERKDGLCKEHAKQLKDGLIYQDENGKWTVKEEPKTPATENKSSELTCLICGKPSNGQHFCKECWKDYHNKILYLKIKNCNEFEKLESEYESELLCDDGHLVKSPYEKLIDNWLYSEGIKHAYEKKLDINEKEDITPDFYLSEYNGVKNIYIEFWGYDSSNIKYQKYKEYKKEIYPKLVKRDNITVVYLEKKDIDNDTFKKKIKYVKQGEIKE